MYRNHGFTLIEVLVVIIILAILVAIAIPIYQGKVEEIKMDICAAHEEAITEAIKIYDMKYDHVPASLAKVWRRTGNEALAVVWGRKKAQDDYVYLVYMSFKKIKYFLADIFSLSAIHAQSFRDELADKGILKCPSDRRPNVDNSYAINPAITGLIWHEIGGDILIVGDSDDGAVLIDRHRRGARTGSVVTDKDNSSVFRRQEDEGEEAINNERTRQVSNERRAWGHGVE